MSNDFGFESATTKPFFFISYNSEDTPRIAYVPNSLRIHYLWDENTRIKNETSILTDTGFLLGNIPNSENKSRGYLTFRLSVN